mmetsp:Transcript_99848/g.177716  ORF Transcript_99848/g.177716 Transcript_99848/m.177716 type:complete len:269 (+) Transcript_99848:836-1642(+)
MATDMTWSSWPKKLMRHSPSLMLQSLAEWSMEAVATLPVITRPAPFAASLALRAVFCSNSASPATTASCGTIHVPPTATTCFSMRYASRFCSCTPPVGMKVTPGKGAMMAFNAAGPPFASAGKNFKVVRPHLSASSTSEAVAMPGMTGIARSRHHSTTSGFRPGETMNFAPAFTAVAACSRVNIVPAPTIARGSEDDIFRRAFSASAVRKTTSITWRPPSTKAVATLSTWPASGTATTGTTRTILSWRSSSCSAAKNALLFLGCLDLD